MTLSQRLSKVTGRIKHGEARQLYMTVSVPGFTYGAEVWYTPIFKPGGMGRTKGSVAITNKLCSTQCKAAKTVTGALSSTAGDILNVHANLLPIDLLFSKILFRAAIHICSLPQSHPLHSTIRKAVCRPVKRHCSPLHNLLCLANISPNKVETITAVRHSPGYTTAFKSFISSSKERALEVIEDIERSHPIQVFSDGSGFEGGIRASAVLFINNHIAKVLHYHLGSEKEHTVYEAEGVGIAMALYMLKTRNRQLSRPLSICSDSQALLKALGNQRPHVGHYILNKIHDLAEQLHAKKDGLLNGDEHCIALAEGRVWKGNTNRVIDLQMHWVPGHCGNDKTRKQMKKQRRQLREHPVKLSSFPHSCKNLFRLVFQPYVKTL